MANRSGPGGSRGRNVVDSIPAHSKQPVVRGSSIYERKDTADASTGTNARSVSLIAGPNLHRAPVRNQVRRFQAEIRLHSCERINGVYPSDWGGNTDYF
jgi:hypothetical protein